VVAPLGLAEVLGRRRDIEPAQLSARECARSALRGGEAQHLAQLAAGGVALDAAPAEDRHPQITRGVHGEAVRCADVLGHRDQHPTTSEGAALGVEGERAHDAGAAVGEVHRATVGAPAQTIGDGEVAQHQPGAPVAIESIERPAERPVIIGQRASPEAALGVARRVVHPGARRCDVGDPLQRALGRQVGEAPASGQQPPLVAVDGRHRADGPGQAVAPDGDEAPVIADPVAVEAAGEDVDAQELAVLGVPASPFAEDRLAGRARDGVSHFMMLSTRRPRATPWAPRRAEAQSGYAAGGEPSASSPSAACSPTLR
jgi:hypothetical protein